LWNNWIRSNRISPSNNSAEADEAVGQRWSYKEARNMLNLRVFRKNGDWNKIIELTKKKNQKCSLVATILKKYFLSIDFYYFEKIRQLIFKFNFLNEKTLFFLFQPVTSDYIFCLRDSRELSAKISFPKA